MPPEVMAHLFEPFFTTKPPGKGTGLGLAQVYGIVKQHMGHIGVETGVGQGTIFSVYLPAYLDQEVEETAPAEETPLPMGQGESILLVEDEEGMREVAREILETLGYRVLTAANGRAALEVYHAEGGVDLLLTDVIMPEMGGRELVRRLRQEHPQLKVLAITGYLLAEDLESLRQDSILDVLHKPFEVNSLAQVVRRALDA
jgi:CheY-like chemotaxis protein